MNGAVAKAAVAASKLQSGTRSRNALTRQQEPLGPGSEAGADARI